MSGLVEDMVQKKWDALSARVFVLISFLIQVELAVFAYSRNTNIPRRTFTTLAWFAYLFADWVAAFAMGLISSGQETTGVNSQLAMLWASSLLLHLGGADAMTAFSVGDNVTWTRNFLGLILQLTVFIYTFKESLPNDYWIPVTLMFFAGAYKYAERTYCLYRASFSTLKKSLLPKPDPGPNYAQFMEEYAVLRASQLPIVIKTENEPEIPDSAAAGIHGRNMVVEGYNLFNYFKGVLVGLRPSYQVINESRKFFFSIEAVDAFRVLEVELNFMYDTLYTKYALLNCKTGYFCRFLCIGLTAVSIQQFASHSHYKIPRGDITFTYVLLGWAVSLELVGICNLLISDWSIISANQTVSSILVRIPFFKRTRRWSNTMCQRSFLSFCLEEHRRLDRLADFIGIKVRIDELQQTRMTKCEESLKKFIFNELKGKAEKACTTEIAKEVFSARGKWVLLEYLSDYDYPSISSSLGDEVEYDESLLLWHIATEICYLTSSGGDPDDRKFCKVLSDYMLYLLIMNPDLMSPVAGIADVRIQDTREEAKIFFTELSSTSVDQRERLSCEKLLNVDTSVNPKLVKGDKSKSLLFDACILAKDLNKLGQDVNEETRWKMMSRIWVELLSYSAGHCQPDAHAEQLRQGGELITFVWLLMLHFGLGEQFRMEAGHPGAKLVVSN